MTDNLRDAFRKGRDAKRLGVPAYRNPFVDFNSAVAWCSGWHWGTTELSTKGSIVDQLSIARISHSQLREWAT